MPRPTDVPWWRRWLRRIEHHMAWPVDRAPLDDPDHDPRPEDEAPTDPWAVRDREIDNLRGDVDALRTRVEVLEASPERATKGLPSDPAERQQQLDDIYGPPPEPGQRERAPTWNATMQAVRDLRRETDWQPAQPKPLGPTRADKSFETHRPRMDGSRRGPKRLYVKTDRDP